MTEIPRMRMLLVDDRPDKLLALEAILSDLPLEIIRADSGRAALRYLLQEEVSLILLDVDMPGLDGFETAALLRQRRSTEHVPIIFVTAYSDELFVQRGYALGAVDYLLQPIIPDVLRTKVSVFVDLYRKTEELKHQAQRQAQRAAQLQMLASAAVAINAQPALPGILQTVVDRARAIIVADQAIMRLSLEPRSTSLVDGPRLTAASFSDARDEWSHRTLNPDACLQHLVDFQRPATRLTGEEIRANGGWANGCFEDVPPLDGLLAAPLRNRSGLAMGALYLTEKSDGAFTADDEAIAVQLAQMAAVAIENFLSAEAREANRIKDQFLAQLSHELRTPLTPVLALLPELEQDQRLPADMRESLGMLHRNIDLEARLIDDLLDLTRINKGKLQLQLQPVSVHSVIKEAMRICNGDISSKNLQVTLDLSAGQCTVEGDPTRLQQVFWNLIKNAVKFTPAGGAVHVLTSNQSPESVCVEVRDTGIGIEADVLPKIFQPFEQGRRAITQQFGGLGLGLAISRRVVDLHNGTLTAKSAGKDGGAQFFVTLPTIAAPVAEQAPPLPRTARPAEARCLHILLVEDHPDTATVMSRLLRSLGHTVVLAHGVQQGASVAAEHPVDLLISDIGLPDGSGLDLVRLVKLRHGDIPAIALSGFGMEEDVHKSKHAGFNEHITKPLNFQQLCDAIDRLSRLSETPGQAASDGVATTETVA